MYMKICAVGDVLDVITCAKFQKKFKFLGVTILHGVEFSIFPIDVEWALQQCSATALPVMLSGYSVLGWNWDKIATKMIPLVMCPDASQAFRKIYAII